MLAVPAQVSEKCTEALGMADQTLTPRERESAYNLLINTCFKKQDSHLITYKSGNAATQFDYMFRKRLGKLVIDLKVIPEEEVALQHQLLVCDMQMARPPETKQKFFRLNVWRLKDPESDVHSLPRSLQRTYAFS